MKVKFNKPVSVDYYSFRLQEWVDKSFGRNDVVEINRVVDDAAKKWVDIVFDNGDVANDVPRESFELC